MKQARNTAAKTEILQLISRSEVALSHAEIQSALEGLCDRVTIYRVLDRLTEEGVIHRVINSDGGVKYASCRTCTTAHSHSHIHFSCEQCKAVTCLKDVVPAFQLPANYTLTEAHFTVSGICAQCA